MAQLSNNSTKFSFSPCFGMGDISSSIVAVTAGPYAHEGFVTDLEFPIPRYHFSLKEIQPFQVFTDDQEHLTFPQSPILPQTPPSTPVSTPRSTPDSNTRAKFRADRMARRKSSTYDKSPQRRRDVEDARRRAQIRSATSSPGSSQSSASSSQLYYLESINRVYTPGVIRRYMMPHASSSRVKVEDTFSTFPSQSNMEDMFSYMSIDDDEE